MIATDSDREGEAIARLIINLSGNSRKTIKRLWINSLETSEIKKGFQNLKDGQAFYSTYKEAETRQIADWLVGINLTRQGFRVYQTALCISLCTYHSSV